MIRKVITTMTNLIILSQWNRILKEKLENRYFLYLLQTFLLHGTCNRMYNCKHGCAVSQVLFITRDQYKSPLTLCSFSNCKGRLAGIDGLSLTRVSWKVKTKKSAMVETILAIKMNRLPTLMQELYCQQEIQRLFPDKMMMRLVGVLPKKRRSPWKFSAIFLVGISERTAAVEKVRKRSRHSGICSLVFDRTSVCEMNSN